MPNNNPSSRRVLVHAS